MVLSTRHELHTHYNSPPSSYVTTHFLETASRSLDLVFSILAERFFDVPNDPTSPHFSVTAFGSNEGNWVSVIIGQTETLFGQPRGGGRR